MHCKSKAKQSKRVSNKTIDRATSNQQWGEKGKKKILIQSVQNLTSWYQANHYWVSETTVSSKYEARYSKNEKTENWKEVEKERVWNRLTKKRDKKSHINWIIYLELRFWLPY